MLSKIFAIWNVASLCSQRSSWITLSKSGILHSSMPSRIWMIVWHFCSCSAHFPHYIWYHVNSRIFAVAWLLNFCTISLPRNRCARYSSRSRGTISRQRSRDRRSHGLCHIIIHSSRNRARRLISKSCPYLWSSILSCWASPTSDCSMTSIWPTRRSSLAMYCKIALTLTQMSRISFPIVLLHWTLSCYALTKSRKMKRSPTLIWNCWNRMEIPSALLKWNRMHKKLLVCVLFSRVWSSSSTAKCHANRW